MSAGGTGTPHDAAPMADDVRQPDDTTAVRPEVVVDDERIVIGPYDSARYLCTLKVYAPSDYFIEDIRAALAAAGVADRADLEFERKRRRRAEDDVANLLTLILQSGNAALIEAAAARDDEAAAPVREGDER